MIKTLKQLSILSASAILATTVSLAANAEQLRMGAMPVGSGWYVGAAAIQKMLEEKKTGIDIEIIARGGGVANPMVVESGKAHVAISNVATSLWAANGELLYSGKNASSIRSLVGGLNPVFVGAIVRNEYMEENGFNTLDDILESGKPVNIMMKPAGSNIPPVVEVILESHGTSIDKIKSNGGSVIQVNPAQMSGLMRDGRADLYFDTILRGHPTITEISLTGDVRFIDISDKSLEALTGIGLQKGSYPKWFEAQTGSNVGGNFGTHLIVNESMSEETAYQLTKLIVENMDQLANEFKAWKAFKVEDAAKPENNGIPMHPGAIRYFKERGFI